MWPLTHVCAPHSTTVRLPCPRRVLVRGMTRANGSAPHPPQWLPPRALFGCARLGVARRGAARVRHAAELPAHGAAVLCVGVCAPVCACMLVRSCACLCAGMSVRAHTCVCVCVCVLRSVCERERRGVRVVRGDGARGSCWTGAAGVPWHGHARLARPQGDARRDTRASGRAPTHNTGGQPGVQCARTAAWCGRTCCGRTLAMSAYGYSRDATMTAWCMRRRVLGVGICGRMGRLVCARRVRCVCERLAVHCEAHAPYSWASGRRPPGHGMARCAGVWQLNSSGSVAGNWQMRARGVRAVAWAAPARHHSVWCVGELLARRVGLQVCGRAPARARHNLGWAGTLSSAEVWATGVRPARTGAGEVW